MRRTMTILVLVAGVLGRSAASRAQEGGEETPGLPEPRLVAPRNDPDERKRLLQRGGGNAATEKAVDAGLDWLARHQDAPGGWDADGFGGHCDGTECDGIGKGQHGEEMPCPFDAPITALATLAFLGRGHLPGTEGDPYAEVVEKALDRLDGAHGRWSLPLATQAFAEAEALDRRGRWRAQVGSGAEALLSRRGKDGAWGYAAGFRPGSDVPYTALVVQALLTARDAGAELPEDFADGLDRYLSSLEEKKGRLAYLVNGRRYGYTPTTSNAHCAAAIRELLGVGTASARHRSHMGLVAKYRPVWKISFKTVKVPGRGEIPVQVGHLSMYQWWYGTLAAYHAGGSSWSPWWSKLKGALVRHQVKRGCARGSWDPKGTYERQTGGRVFATALGVLMLEQPYRHLRD